MRLDARAILDANVVVSALLSYDSPPSRSLKHVIEFGSLILSEAIFAEYAEVLFRAKFDTYATRQAREDYLAGIVARAKLIEVSDRFAICRDPKDDKYLEACVAGRVDALISGDQDLLALGSFQSTVILDPSAFLQKVADTH